jgi:threonine/homoserine/homoserine lactone efflux protein
MAAAPLNRGDDVPAADALLKMTFYVALVLALPGPTNTLLLSAGLRVGLRGSWRLVIAEALGYVVAISSWGFFLCAFAASRPWLYGAVKLASAAFIVHLAIKMWSKRLGPQQAAVSPVRFIDVLAATVMNPKAFLFASAVFPPEAFQSGDWFAWTMGAFLVVLMPIGIGWSCLGGLLTTRRALAQRTSTLMRCASVALLSFSATLVFSVLNK